MSKWKWSETSAGKAVQGKGLFTRFVGWLNSLFNEDHPWFDYDKWGNIEDSITNQITQDNLTGQQVALNEMQMQNQEDIYQRQVSGMQKAGLNPALMYGSGAVSAPSAPSAQGSGVNMSDLMQAILLPAQLKALKAQVANTEANTANTKAKTENTKLDTERLRSVIEGIGLDNDKKEILLRYVDKQQQNELDIASLTIDEKRAGIESIYASIDKMDMEQCRLFYQCLEAQENISLMYTQSVLNVGRCEEIAHNIEYIDAKKQLVGLNIQDWNYINVIGSSSASAGLFGLRGSETHPVTLDELKRRAREREKAIEEGQKHQKENEGKSWEDVKNDARDRYGVLE